MEPGGAAFYKVRDGVTFLNHGSFGKCPTEILLEQQRLRDELELEPVDFLARQMYPRMETALSQLEHFINAEPHSCVFTHNVSAALSSVVRSLPPIGEDHHVLTTDHEYGACDRLWTFVLEQSKGGAQRYRRVPLAILDDPSCTPESVAADFCSHFNQNTKICFFSHITSVTALTLPAQLICAEARKRGIITIVDGAHALGQLDLDMKAIGADYYAGNCHKWLQTPKGAGFLYASPARQAGLSPLVISWGWRRTDETMGVGVPTLGSDFQDAFAWPGTDDPTAFLCVPSCIAFQKNHDWTSVRKRCHSLARYARKRVQELTGVRQLFPDSPDFYTQMALLPLPDGVNAKELHTALFEKYLVEIPGIVWKGQHFLRISVAYYTKKSDVDRFVDCLALELSNKK